MTTVVPGPVSALPSVPVPAAPSVAVSGGRAARGGRRGGRLALLARPLVPALLVAAGYVDPGNWGADVAAGARFGFRLTWVLVLATVGAGFLQTLAARLGVASGHDLAELVATRVPRAGRVLLVPPLLAALGVTEIVEVLGIVIGLRMLTSWSTLPCLLAAGGLVLAVCLARPGPARATVLGCVGLVGVVYLAVLVTHGSGVVAGAVPGPSPDGGLPVAVAVVGAVVMPHNILLHSTLARDARDSGGSDDAGRRRTVRTAALATTVALVVALGVNLGIMSVAVVATSTGADLAGGDLAAVLSSAAPATTVLFAVTLVAAGLASTVTGGMVGADTVARLVPRLRLGERPRRLLCLLPAGAVLALGLPEVAVLVWSQVVLTVALPLVLVPLLWFVGRRDLCGALTVSSPVRVLTAVLVLALCAAGLASLATA